MSNNGANGMPTSPLSLGGPLSTPTQNGHVPQSPFMVNGMGINYGMGQFPFMVSPLRSPSTTNYPF